MKRRLAQKIMRACRLRPWYAFNAYNEEQRLTASIIMCHYHARKDPVFKYYNDKFNQLFNKR